MDLTVRGGTVVSGSGSRRLDLAIRDGVIAGVGADVPDAGPVVDASGLLVLPGMVDTHVHLMDPGPTEREDFPTGSSAAAARGVTTIVEHTHAHPIRTPDDMEAKRRYLEGRSHVDYGLAAHVWPDRIDSIGPLREQGITFFKIFTCTTHGVPGLDGADLLAALRAVAAAGGRCLVHCEDEAITGRAEQLLRAEGRVDNAVIPEWRNREAEEAAVAVVATLVRMTGAVATIAHVSSPAVLRLILEARAHGADLAAEACPQYFALREDEVLDLGPLRKFTPPARVRSDEEAEAMLGLLADGEFSHVSSDHAPSTLAQKSLGDIWEAPFGLPGLDTTMPWLLDLALSGQITLERLVQLYAESPAERYGLAPRKGHLIPGSDADFVLIDPDGSFQLDNETVISKAAWSPYAPRIFQGRAVATYLRGRQIAGDGAPLDTLTGGFITPDARV
jgi:allantoinase